MNFKSTLIIITVLVGIAATYFLFFNEPIDETTENSKPKIDDTYDLQRTDIQKITLSYADKAYQTLTLHKDNKENWKLTKPFQAYADKQKVTEMLTDFLSKRIKQTLDGGEYERYGLENPTITVQLWKNIEHAPKTFLIGKKGANFSVYTKEKSETHIFLIESSALDDMLKAPTDLRDKAAITFNPNSINEIQFHKPEQLICQKEGDSWKMVQPLTVNAHAEEIKNILSQLHALQVTTFELNGDDATSALDKYGLDKPIISFSMKSDKESYGILIGAAVHATSLPTVRVGEENKTKNQLVYAKSLHQDSIYTIKDDILRTLNKTVHDLQDRRVIDFQREETTKFVIQDSTQKLVGLKGQDGMWELSVRNIHTPTGYAKMKADPQAISDLLYGADALEAIAFLPKNTKNIAQYGLKPPKVQVSFSVRGEDHPTILLIGNDAKDNTVYVKTRYRQSGAEKDQISRVKTDLINKIKKAETWLRDKNIFKFSIDDPIQVTIKYHDVSFTCQRLGTNWRLTQPVKENANNAEVNAMLYELGQLKAEEFISGPLSYEGGYRQSESEKEGDEAETNRRKKTVKNLFDTPQIEITIKLRSQKVWTIQIGKQDASGRSYARLLHQPMPIFLLQAELIPKLKTKLEWLRVSEEE